MAKKVFLLADGEKQPLPQLEKLRKGRFCLVLDGAAEQARKARWKPQLVAGDFDSVSPKTLAHFAKKGVTLLHTPDQNYTDLEKALAWCAAQGSSSIWIAQALGCRLDHTLANLAFLKRFHHPDREILLFTATECVRFLKNCKAILKGAAGRGFAVLPFPSCSVSTSGLEYEMRDAKLELGIRESVSNKARKSRIELEVAGEALVIEEIG